MSALEKIAKACAFVIFADGLIDRAEIDSAKKIFKKYGLDENKGEDLLKKELDLFIDESEDEKTEDADIYIGELALEDIDTFEVLKDLTSIAVADGELSTAEVDVIHSLAESFCLDSRFATMAILNAVKSNPSTKISLE